MLDFLKGKRKGNCIGSPCKGKAVALTEVPDPTFSEKILGDGFAVIPSEGKIYAPADGEVTVVFDTLHAITMTTDQGAELLIHIGLDTVTLKGAPFTAHVAAGDHVKKGDLLLDADLEKIQEAGLHIITPVLVCNTDEYNKISILKEGEVSPGEDVLQIRPNRPSSLSGSSSGATIPRYHAVLPFRRSYFGPYRLMSALGNRSASRYTYSALPWLRFPAISMP